VLLADGKQVGHGSPLLGSVYRFCILTPTV
jgi:hypothetical protein